MPVCISRCTTTLGMQATRVNPSGLVPLKFAASRLFWSRMGLVFCVYVMIGKPVSTSSTICVKRCVTSSQFSNSTSGMVSLRLAFAPDPGPNALALLAGAEPAFVGVDIIGCQCVTMLAVGFVGL